MRWTPGSVGSINSAGVYTVPASGGSGPVIVRATGRQSRYLRRCPFNTVLSIISGPGAPGGDTIRLALDASVANQLDVFVNNATGTPSYTASIPAMTTLTISSTAGAGTFVLDYTNGNPLPSGTVTLNGVGNANVLKIIGNGPSDAITIGTGSVIRSSAGLNFSNIQTLELATGTFTPSADLSGMNITVDSGATLLLPAVQHLGVLTLNTGGSASMPAGAGLVLDREQRHLRRRHAGPGSATMTCPVVHNGDSNSRSPPPCTQPTTAASGTARGSPALQHRPIPLRPWAFFPPVISTRSTATRPRSMA